MNRLIAALLVVLLFVSSVVPASAVGFALPPDTASVQLWNSAVSTPPNGVLNTLAGCFGVPVTVHDVFWHMMDIFVGSTGEHTLDYMNDLVGRYNSFFTQEYQSGALSTSLKGFQVLVGYTFVSSFFGRNYCDFELVKASGSGLLRIREKNSGIWVVNSAGEYPYCEGGSMAPVSGGNQWIGERSCSTAKVNMKNLDVLNLLCNKIKESGTPAQIKPLGTKYKAIWYNRQYYCDPEGRPFVCYANESNAAINQDRPDTSVKDENGKPATDESGTVINNPDNSTNIDLSGMTITLPNGDVQIADAVIYDESTKTYNIDSHDTTNYNITYNYSWTYHINYTSITYIGQTAEYDKKYEVYYQLPDGRDSADLTAEELEQIDYSLDVVGYGRSADDTSLRSLYHFDGDTHDSSYWNYCTNFQWVSGASLTYMDSGPFKGSLYLDENQHDFVFWLPSNIGSGDFTMQFRYYQSATAAPQTDSFIALYSKADYSTWSRPLLMDGQYLKTESANIAKISTGQWNEICIQRSSGYLWYMLNGVVVGSPLPDTTFYYDRIYFGFGSSQQTFKYFDEFRFVNKGLYVGGYTPTSVPHDTNLTLVLPDTARPVADEFWRFDKTIAPVFSYDFTGFKMESPFNMSTGVNNISVNKDGLHFDPGLGILRDQVVFSLPHDDISYTFSVVSHDGTVYSAPISYPADKDTSKFFDFPWGRLQVMCGLYANPEDSTKPLIKITFIVHVNDGQSLDLIYAEVVPGLVPNTGHEYITKIVPVTNYDKPTLAVRTDIPITGKQIGGPRPSLPTKGLVWGMVESGVLRSLQIYNGQAWEACDGRIFTGTRWIPYGSYNILTMKDFYDVVDASGDSYEYIYTQSGFWNWWQRTWNAFTTKLFAKLDSLGSGASDGATSDASPVVPDVDITVVQNESKDSTNFLVKVLYKLFFKDAVNNVKGAAFDFAGVFGVSVADEATSSGSGSSESTSPSSSSASDSGGGTTVTLFPLMDGDSIWD
ncbi:hypothetical protein [Oscillibacter ruminantium]|uniref:hypothetical protein n=1 Tax=Oscillibacter ruminantium TaxID=1263547 RepID=UPI000317FF6E|nr:hypothetical protein [Oscillibacter ruminantium]